MSSIKKIKMIQQEINELLMQLLEIKTIAKGSYGITYRRCGKTNCWCNDKELKGHPYRRITWNDNGVARTKSISEKDKDRVFQLTENYKKFRKFSREVRELEKKKEILLKKHEGEIRVLTK